MKKVSLTATMNTLEKMMSPSEVPNPKQLHKAGQVVDRLLAHYDNRDGYEKIIEQLQRIDENVKSKMWGDM